MSEELGYSLIVGGTPNEKNREFACDDCLEVWDKLVMDADRKSQTCPICDGPARYVISAPSWWVNSKAERTRKLKERSKAHSAMCRKQGIDPSSTGYNPGDASWRAKRRARNTSAHTLEQNSQLHKGWIPGKQRFIGDPSSIMAD